MGLVAAARSDASPVLPSRGLVHARAVELVALAKRAEEFSRAGHSDLGLALRQFERMRAILGGNDG